ncbi:flavin reductase family protein [Gordonia jinghuaiqii]|uniref:Flavin reductase family protein n=1 Tax=Gordonia jinghuaiqii TaxID=2758710 RepID=A0A7D7LSX5_9ACTN|nr:flavin reductase family protein [Gordonia jinghuaiqii]MCR5979375.1 flavin reductase family protein [Gordonia jinghuaiqii]QMT01157.1 flavin reductase family protein [Gordonia jinghuaiqii]
MTQYHSYEPSQGHRLSHDPVNAIVAPRPIGWISSVSDDGVRNLAPYSFFNLFNYTPPIVGFASIGYKDTLANATTSGEFVWNLATDELGEKMNATSAAVPADEDEFVVAGLTPLDSDLVTPPRVAESPVSFECRVSQSFQLRTAAGESVDTWMVLGEVVKIHIATDLLTEDQTFDTAGARPLLRAGGVGDYYLPSAEHHRFMKRPKPATR